MVQRVHNRRTFCLKTLQSRKDVILPKSPYIIRTNSQSLYCTKIPAKTFTNVGMVQRIIKNRVCAPTHHTGNKSPDTRRGSLASLAIHNPLQVTVHCLQETLYPGQHSQASRHFEAIVTILTSGNICSEDGMHLYTLKQRCMVHTDMQVRPLTQYVAGDTAVSTYMV